MESIAIYDLIDEFLSYSKFKCNLSDHTLYGFSRSLDCFLNFLANRFDNPNLTLIDLKKYDAQDWLYLVRASEKNSGKSMSSLNLSRYAIRSFFNFLDSEGYFRNDFASTITGFSLRPTKIKPDSFVTIDLNKFVKSASDNVRDYAILKLLVEVGLSLPELVRLNLDDYNAENIKIAGVLIELDASLVEAIENYLKSRINCGSNSLFVSRNHNRLCVRQIGNIIKKYSHKSGFGNVSSLAIRYCIINNLYGSTHSLELIRDKMRYNSAEYVSKILRRIGSV